MTTLAKNKPQFSISKFSTATYHYLYLHSESDKEELLFATIDLSTGEFHLQPMSITLGNNLHQVLHELMMDTIFTSMEVLQRKGDLESRKIYCV